MSIKRINNLLKSIKDSYKSLEDGIYKVSEVVKPPKGPKLSLYNIYIFEFLIMFYSLLIGLLHIKVKEKYIFVNVRFGDLIHSLDKKDVLVCGGKKDFLYCLKHRIKFKWIGFLIKAFDIYYYYGRDKSYVEALNLLNKLFSDDKEKQFIFLWDDMQKLGTSFAHVFRQRDSIEVVCIQHGIYVFNDSNISPGSNSNYNFVFKSSQIDLIKGANENNSFVMGLSYNVSAPAMFKKNIYLVGIGALGANDPDYLLSLWFYLRICKEFSDTEYTVYYRPHPVEDLEFCNKCFTNIDTTPIKNILNSFSSIYIGFNSTVLYEAKVFGNIVIKIEDKETFPLINDFDVDFLIDKNNIGSILSKLNEYISNEYISNEYSLPTYQDSINSRFMKCLDAIRFNDK